MTLTLRKGLFRLLVLFAAAAFGAPDAWAIAPEDSALCIPQPVDAELAVAACGRIAQEPNTPTQQRAVAFGIKGMLLLTKLRSPDAAIAALDEAIRLSPRYTAALFYRGQARTARSEFDLAIQDYNVSIEVSPRYSPAFDARGSAWAHKGDFERAAADFEAALRVSQNGYSRAKNNFAWLLATAPDSKFRNGKRAVMLAVEACESTRWQIAGYVDTLAAAFAEAGNFAKAIEMEKRALEIGISNDAQRKKADARLELYRQGKPFRDMPIQ